MKWLLTSPLRLSIPYLKHIPSLCNSDPMRHLLDFMYIDSLYNYPDRKSVV